MSKPKKKKKKWNPGGPYISAAVFCENMLQDQSQSASIIKIHDGLALVMPADAEMPTKEKPVHLVKQMFICIKGGDFPGKHTVEVKIRNPDGRLGKPVKNPAGQEFELPNVPNGGINIFSNITFTVYSSGVFWFDIVLDGKLMTRIPLLIDLRREESNPQSQEPTKK